MQQTIGDTDVILTDNSYLSWTILSYYVPNASYKLISTGFTEFEPDKVYWLVWSRDLTESDLSWLKGCGYSVSEAYHDGVLGTYLVHVYSLLPDVIAGNNAP